MYAPLAGLESILTLPSPIQKLDLANTQNYEIYIKRDDLIHPLISGNKWRKLKYNLSHFIDNGQYDGLITWGGAFSNHLVAVAAACDILRIPCTALVRTSNKNSESSTIRICKSLNMNVLYQSKDEYASRYEPIDIPFVGYDHPFILPEGGSNQYALQGCVEIMDEISFAPDFIVLPIGTGATMNALCARSTATVIGISPFKEGSVHIPFADRIAPPHRILYDYALTGYGRYIRQLVDFINVFWNVHGIPLDPIYTGKSMMALSHLVENQHFPPSSKILFIHTGGLQGIAGYDEIHGHKRRIDFSDNIYFPAIGR